MSQGRRNVLSASDVTKSFGGFYAVNGVSLDVFEGEALAIIGPNGAGKSTFFDLLTGRKRPTSGEIRLFGEPVTRLPPWKRVKRGIGRSFQVSSVFRSASVLENVQIGLMLASGRAWNMFGRATATFRPEAEAIVAKVGLAAKSRLPAGDLSYGDQRTLELAVALSTNPRVLLLDEPTAGMGREESRECLRLIRSVAESENIPIVFVEHDMSIVFSFATRIAVLAAGKLIVEGEPDVVRADPHVKEVYFGEDI